MLPANSFVQYCEHSCGHSDAVNWPSFLADPKISRICKKSFCANPVSGDFARSITACVDFLSCKFLKFRFLQETFLATRRGGQLARLLYLQRARRQNRAPTFSCIAPAFALSAADRIAKLRRMRPRITEALFRRRPDHILRDLRVDAFAKSFSECSLDEPVLSRMER